MQRPRPDQADRQQILGDCLDGRPDELGVRTEKVGPGDRGRRLPGTKITVS